MNTGPLCLAVKENTLRKHAGGQGSHRQMPSFLLILGSDFRALDSFKDSLSS